MISTNKINGTSCYRFKNSDLIYHIDDVTKFNEKLQVLLSF